MTIDSMRVGGGRCPPLIVGGLIIACIMMLCNWWTLSSTNLELLRQIDELNEQIKISVDERDQCVTQRGNFEKQLNECQVNTRRINVKLSQVEDESNTNKKVLDSYKALDVHKTATLDTMRVSQKAIQIQLNSQQAENKKLEEEKKQLIEEKKKLEEELDKAKNELKDAKLTVNAPSMNQVPVMPIASTTPIVSSAQLAPVKISAVHVSKIGDKGIIYHNIPILPDDPPGAVRRAPRFSVTKLKTHVLGNKTSSVNVAPKPQVNPPPNADTQGQEQEKDNSNKEDNAAEVEGVNAMNPDLTFNLVSEMRA